VWYVSYGLVPANALPEIYNTSGLNAIAWKNISLWRRIVFSGTTTQYLSCQQDPAREGCGSGTNTPWNGWSQLYYHLNSHPMTAQSLTYSTDVLYQVP
jgi:hypothetical protein